MFTFNMPIQITWCSCRMVTFITRTSHFMFTFNMFLQIPCFKCSMVTPCLFSTWIFRFLAAVAKNLHWEQVYLPSLCLISSWTFRLPAVVDTYLHCKQRYLTPSCLFSTCNFRYLAEVAAYWHCEQGYLTPSCLFSTWLFRAPAVVAAYSQWGQGYQIISDGNILRLLHFLFFIVLNIRINNTVENKPVFMFRCIEYWNTWYCRE